MQNVSFKLSQSLMALALVGLVWSAVAPSAEAARASKPKEIVVVGSKVKEVVREAGMDIDENAIRRLSWRLRHYMYESMHRARKNERRILTAMDLSCPLMPDDGDVRMNKADLVHEIAEQRGFHLDEEYELALNAQTNQLLADAIVRARGNNRSTVRPHDL
jgi:hypothetical protein